MSGMDRFYQRQKEKQKSSAVATQKSGMDRYYQNQRYRSMDTSGVDQKYIDSFIKDSNAFLTTAEKDHGGLGWGTASSAYESRNTAWQDLTARADAIGAWLFKNRDSLDRDAYDSLNTSLEGIRRGGSSVLDAFKNASDYYSQWDTEDAYNEWYAEEQRKEAERQAIISSEDFSEYSKKGAGEALTVNNWGLVSGGKNKVAGYRGTAGAMLSAQGMRGGATDPEISQARAMSEDEANIYSYFFAKYGEDKANEYFDSLKEELNKRIEGTAVQNMMSFADEHPVWASAMSPMITLSSAGEYVGDLFTGDQRNMMASANSALRGTVSNKVDWEIGNWDAFDFVYNTAMSGADSLVMSQAFGPAGGVVLGLSAAASATNDALDRGLSKDKAFWNGITAGVFEGLFETISIGNFNALKEGASVTFKEIAKNIGKSMLVNASEETLTEIANITYDIIANDDLSNYVLTVNGYMEAGMSEAEAKRKAALEIAGQVVEAGASGALMGAGFGAIGGATGYYRTSKAAKKTYGDGTNLVKATLELDPVNALAQEMQAKVDSGKSLSGGQMARLVESNEQTRNDQNIADIASALQEKGMSAEEAMKTAKWLYKATEGETYNRRQRKAYESDDRIADVHRDLFTNEENSVNKRNADYEALYALAQEVSGATAENAPSQAEASAQQAEAASPTENAPTAEKVTEGKFEASAEGKTTHNGNEVKIRGIASIDNGEVMVQLDNDEVVNARDVEFSTADEALIYEATANMDTDTANDFIQGFNDLKNAPMATTQSAYDYMLGFNEAITYGELGIPYEAMARDGKYANALIGNQAKIAYNRGKINAIYKAKASEASRTSSKATPSKTPRKYKGETHVSEVKKSRAYKSLSDTQKAGIAGMTAVYKALGIDVYFFESPTDSKGNRTGKNGYFNPSDNSVHIDLYAGLDGRGLILFTGGHELTHHIRANLPTKFKAFAEILFEQYEANGTSVASLIAKKRDSLEKKGRITPDMTSEEAYDLAYEEVVADACEAMLGNGEAFAQISERVKAKDEGLWNAIKKFFADLVAKIKAAYAELSPDSIEGQKVAEMLETATDLQQMWVDMLVEASEASDIAMVDASTESVAPMFSERTWTASEYVIHRDAMAKKIAKALGVSTKKAKSYIDDINSIAKMIADDRTRLDYEASSFGSAFVSNVEYGGSFDYTTLCKKRRIYTGTFTEIQKRLHDVALSPDDILKIRNLMIEEGIEATCGLCYVEGSRANMGKFAKEFIRLYKRDNPGAWIPNMADVNTPDGVEQMRINHPEAYDQYVYFWNHYGKLKDSDKALFASQQKPKLYEARKEYKGEILDHFKGDTSVARKNLNGGIRMQSFSDFEIVHLIDTMQVIMDMSTVGLAGQAYTKVPEFAKAFGNTGLKINLSLIAKGVDADGKLIFDDREGMPHETAFALRNQYSANVGTIIVTFTDEQLLAAMADPRIDFIIPFHRSQWKKGQYGAMGLPKGTKDYTYMQNEKLIKKTYHEYRGRMVLDKASNYMPNEYWDFSKSGKENAEAYLKMCAENNKRPKFYKLLDYDGKGTYSLKADGSTDGYWKLLIDFKMYDNDGVGSPQQAVTPTFNMDEAKAMLDEYKGGHSKYPVASSVVDTFVNEYNKANGTKYSDRDSDGNTLSKEQQEFFKDSEIRDRNGNLLVCYHATDADFTIFEKAKIGSGSGGASFGKGFYFTPKRYIAGNYGSKLGEYYLNIKNPFEYYTVDKGYIVDMLEKSGYEYDKQFVDSYDYDDLWDADLIDDFLYDALPGQKPYDLFSQMLQNAGFDGIWIGDEIVAFESEQIKRTDNLNPTSNPDIRFSDRDSYAPTFYSHMGKVIDDIKLAKMGAGGVVPYLKGKGVKNEEIKWSGIEAFLEGKKSVTKAELQEFVAGSQLQIEETTLDDRELPMSQDRSNRIAELEAERSEIVEHLKSEWKRIVGTDIPISNFGAGLESVVSTKLVETDAKMKGETDAGRRYAEVQKALKECIEDNDDFGYDNTRQAYAAAVRNPEDFLSSYELSASEEQIFRDLIEAKRDYQEAVGIPVQDRRALLAIAEKSDRVSRKISDVKSEHYADEGKFHTKWKQYRIDGGSNYRELVFKIPNSTYSNDAMAVHWGYEAEGILAHARIQDITTKDGKNMLFIEEIQSDWHNEGAKRGYVGDDLTKQYEAAMERFVEHEFSLEMGDGEYELYKEGSDLVSTADLEYYKRFEKRLREKWKSKHPYESFAKDQATDAPFRTTYHEYVLKRLLRMAAEEGYDSLGWTPADIQSERWSDEYAEGYRIEYDQDIPKFLRKYGKKWGATVGKTTLQGVETKEIYYDVNRMDSYGSREAWENEVLSNLVAQGMPRNDVRSVKFREEGDYLIAYGKDGTEYDRAEIRRSGDSVWSMDITDSMRDSVLHEGQVMYSDRNFPDNAEDIAKKHFGTTTNWSETGWLLTDGTQLDFSGRHWENDPDSEIDLGESYYRGKRNVEHYEIAEAFTELRDFSHMEYRGEHLDGFLSRGNIRIVRKGCIDLQVMPTDEQFKKLRGFFNESIDAHIIIGIGLDGLEFSKGTKASTIIEGIRDYFSKNRGQQSDLMRFHTMYSDRDPDAVSNRSLLANALESVAQNDIERSKLNEYKGKIALIESEQAKLAETKAKIKELSFATGRRDTEAIKRLQFEANQSANRINTYDRQLLSLEATAALKGVLQREKQLAYKKAEREGKEALARYREKAAKTQRELLTRYQESRKKGVEGRRKTEMRHKIKAVVNELNQYLLNGTKEKHVPIELQKAVAEALDAVNMDTVSAEERIAKKREEMLKAKTPEAIEKLAKEIETIREMGGNLDAKLARLKTAYDSIINSDDPLIANSHDDVISASIDKVVEVIGDTPLRDMSLYQLEAVYDLYKMVLHSIRAANKAFKAEKGESIAIIANGVIAELVEGKQKSPYSTKASQAVSEFDWNNQKPVYAIERIGSKNFTKVFNAVRAGEDVWANDMSEAQAFREEQFKKYKYDSWDFKKRYRFTSTSGKSFELTLDQILSLYAFSKRAQAGDHLKYGGFVFDGLSEVKVKNKVGMSVTYQLKDATAYNLSDETLLEIIGKLTPEQKEFADAMQDYLSTVMGEKGNEVSLELYDIKLFKEKNYFPLKSAPQYLAKAKEQAQGEVKIKNSGFTKETSPKAKNPIVLSSFMDVWAGHVNEMSMYHAFTLPLEDFYRVYNYHTPADENMSEMSVSSSLENAHGQAAVKYIDQLLKDLNGGARSDPRETLGKSMMSNFKKAAVMASFSVVVQQPTAIVRAMALVNSKYFFGKPLKKKHKDAWAEVKKYAPVAVIKEMGYFDTGMGKGSVEWLKGEKTFMDKVDEVTSKLPELADEVTWVAIWNAVKRETVHTHKHLAPNSDAFLKVVGKRFTEVITKTQVYDSTLSRSANMRSKGVFMQMVTSFLAEPTTSINMLQDAFHKGNKKHIARTMAAVYGSVILNSALVSIVYAMRDDDEDETFLEKYLSRFTTEVIDGVNPLTYLPIVKDIWSAAQGFDIERADMSLITDLIGSFQQMVEVINKDTSDMDEDELAKHKKDVVGSILGITDNISSLAGIPVKNVRRDINGAINFFKTIGSGQKTTAGSLGDTILGDLKDSVPVWGWLPDESKGDKLYDAIIKGDTDYIDRLKGGYKSEESYHTAVGKIVREHLEDGDLTTTEAERILVAHGGKDEAEASSKVQYWEFKQDYPDYDLSEEAVAKYYSDVEPWGINMDVYYDYYKQKVQSKGTDEDGDGRADSGTKKAEVMAVIDSLPISDEQKDALYFLNGWSESTLWQAPWH